MPTVELSSGPVDYVESGDAGPVLIFGHGPPMDHRQWGDLATRLPGYRLVFPTLPMGGHRQPMRADADLTHDGMSNILAELIEKLGFDDVTIVLNDWGGGQFMITEGIDERVSRFVLVNCEAFDNFPPGPAKLFAVLGKKPAGMWLLLQPFRLRAFRQMSAGYGGMSLRGIPDDLLRDWFGGVLSDGRIRRDFAKFATSAPGRRALLDRFERLRTCDKPVLIAWADRDPLMPADHGRRLAELYPNSRLVEIRDSSTLVGMDQPERLAEAMAEFLASTGAPPSGA